jgi:hypothetical protein
MRHVVSVVYVVTKESGEMADYLEIAKRALERYRSQQAESGQQPFPHCPRCGSYALYRKNNQGDYECETCDPKNISQDVARRVQ